MTCDHGSFAAKVDVARLTDDGGGPVRNFLAEVTVTCAECGTPFHFVGLGTGLSFQRPMTDVPATTLYAPITPGERPLTAGTIRFEMAT